MKNDMYGRILTLLFLLSISGCKKEEETTDFYCKVNGERWVVYNSSLGDNKVEAHAYIYGAYGICNIAVVTAPKDEGILSTITLRVDEFNGNGIYDNSQIGILDISLKENEEKNTLGYYGEYEMDTASPANITIIDFNDKRIKGSFDFTLKKRAGAQNALPEKLEFREGRFNAELVE